MIRGIPTTGERFVFMCAWTIDVNRDKQNGGFYLYQHSRRRRSSGNLRVYMSTLRNSFRRKKRRSAQQLEICPVGSIYIYRCTTGVLQVYSLPVLVCLTLLCNTAGCTVFKFWVGGKLNLLPASLQGGNCLMYLYVSCIFSQCVIGYNIHVVNIYI